MKKIIAIFLFNFFFSLVLYAQTGIVEGRIFDEKNNEPIAFAGISIEGTKIGTMSDVDGKFKLSNLSPGYLVLKVSFTGFKEEISSDVFVSNSNPVYLEIGLTEIETELNEVVIKANPFEKKEDALISQQKIGVREIETNPGSNRDISRVIQSFPGVGSTPNFRNDVIVRGGGPSESRFYLDDVEIPVLNHFSTQGASGGPVGIINSDFISTVDYFSGVFPASTNNALSAVFQFTQKDGNYSKFGFQAALGASETSLTMDGPVGKKSSLVFSVRRSYLQFLFSALKLPFLPTFNDYQFKYKINFNNKNNLTLISIGSLDNMVLNTDIENPDASQEYILAQLPVNNQWSYTIGAVYKHFDKNKSHSIILSRNMLYNEFYKYPDNNENLEKSLDYQSSEIENKFRYENTIRSHSWKIESGLSGEYSKYYNKTSQIIFVSDTTFNFKYQTDLELFKYGAYTQVSKSLFTQKLKMTGGFRVDGNTFNKSMQNPLNQISPRASLSYSFSGGLTANAGAGRFFQLPAYTTLGYKNASGDFANENIEYISVNQYNLGISKSFGSRYLIQTEIFRKEYNNYPIDIESGFSLANSGADYSSVNGASAVESTGQGEVSGVEILLRANLDKFTFIGTYTYAISEFSDISSKLLPSSWDSRHLFTATASKSFNGNWSIGMKWRFVGGLPYTPYDLEKSSYIEAWDAQGQAYYDFSRLNTLRYGNFHQLDLRVDKKFFFNKWTLMMYFDVQNAYNFQNKGQNYVIRAKNTDGTFQTDETGTKYILEEIPNYSGTVLPTLGIMVKF